MIVLHIALALAPLVYVHCLVDWFLESRGTYVALDLFGRTYVMGDRVWYDEERRAAMRRHPAGKSL